MRLDPVPGGQAFGIPAKCQRRRRHDVKAFADGRVRFFHCSLKGVRDIIRVHMMQRLQTKVREANRPFVREIVEPYRAALAGTGVKAASVATAFPSGQASLEVKLRDTEEAVAAGAEEIDMVISREAFLAGEDTRVMEEIVRVKEVCGDAHLKVILETGELGTYDNVRRASLLAMAAGADFIKTSTGKIQPAATLPVALVMLEAIRDFHDRTGRMVGMKPAGGVRTAKQAIQHLVVVNETLGPDWLTPEWFRLGASSLLNDCLMQLAKERTGRYQSGDYFTKD